MNIAIVYASQTGNTEKLAGAIRKALANETIVYFGAVPENVPQADLYLVGSGIYKGEFREDAAAFVQKLKNRKLACFATAGYGGSEEYAQALLERLKAKMDSSTEVLGFFFCLGKMAAQVRERYVQLLTQNPDDARLKVSLKNFDEALSHPDDADLQHAGRWAGEMVLKAVRGHHHDGF